MQGTDWVWRRAMMAIVHAFLFLVYGGLAAAAAVLLPKWIGGLDVGQGLLAGGFLFLCAALLHETLTRVARNAGQLERMDEQRRRSAELEDELSWTRRELKVVREVLEEVAKQGPASEDSRIGEVMAELTVLKTLVARLAEAETKPGEPQAPQGPAPLTIRPTRGDAPPARDPNQDEATLALVREALRNDRIELVLQPIVTLPQRKQCSFECYSRLVTADGKRLLPEQYIEIAESAGLITAIDNMLLFRCIQLVRRIERKGRPFDFFCNVSLRTLSDAEFFDDFIAFLEANRDLAGHLIFELSQADFVGQSEAEEARLDRLTGLGCRLSLDHVDSLSFDIAGLAERGIRFVKIDSARITEGNAEDGIRDFQEVSARLRAHEIELIVGKIEQESQLLELLDYGAEMGQGYLFGSPKAAKDAA